MPPNQPTTVLGRLEARIAAKEAEPDGAQRAAATQLDALAVALGAWQQARQRSLWRRIGGQGPLAPRGLYIWGQVGRGKTMLMDMFYEVVHFRRKRRIHFHEFMAEVHDRINAARTRHPGDPIPAVAAEIAQSAQVLCFDEFHVTDIADAMILGRLFTALLALQIVIVATSNVPPDGLYAGGLNRQLFLPFIALLTEKTTVVELVAAKDFRLEKLAGHPLYFTPLDRSAATAIRAAFIRVSGTTTGVPVDLDVKGRKLHVPEAVHGVALFTFNQLCGQPLGPLDYLAIAHAFHTVIIADVPRLGKNKRAEARRFINLIDTLYDARVGLIVSAESEPDDIYPKGDEAFLFERTASRLIEMRSDSYLKGRSDRTSTVWSAENALAE